jgi:hypothetical protein
MTRSCVVCGKELKIELDENQIILSGGYYFGKMKVPTEGAKIVKSWKDKIDDFEFTVVEHSEYEIKIQKHTLTTTK